MLTVRLAILGLAFSLLCLPAQASDEPVEIDKARVFPVQKNTTVIHSSNAERSDVNASSPSGSEDQQKPSPKDTSLQIHGNGGSTNRPAGGSATLRKRFTFD